jgi:hypothetical protein
MRASVTQPPSSMIRATTREARRSPRRRPFPASFGPLATTHPWPFSPLVEGNDLVPRRVWHVLGEFRITKHQSDRRQAQEPKQPHFGRRDTTLETRGRNAEFSGPLINIGSRRKSNVQNIPTCGGGVYGHARRRDCKKRSRDQRARSFSVRTRPETGDPRRIRAESRRPHARSNRNGSEPTRSLRIHPRRPNE